MLVHKMNLYCILLSLADFKQCEFRLLRLCTHKNLCTHTLHDCSCVEVTTVDRTSFVAAIYTPLFSTLSLGLVKLARKAKSTYWKNGGNSDR